MEPFSARKAATLVHFLATAASGMTTLKAMKLVYLCDRTHYIKYRLTITQDTYLAYEHGPVPWKTYELVRSVRNEEEWLPHGHGFLSQLIRFDRSTKHPTIVAVGDAPPSMLTTVEVETVRDVVQKHGHRSATALRNESHRHKAWRAFEHRQVIDQRFFSAEEPPFPGMNIEYDDPCEPALPVDDWITLS